jgi:signal transduction histidine kinase/ligand-binding sensor domain-containing protein
LIQKHAPRLLLLLLSIAASAVSYPFPRVKFENLTMKQGLSTNVVYCTFKDSRGFIWFGTDNGVNRYDSKNILTFQQNKNIPGSLPENLITRFYQHSNDELWLLSMSGALISYKYSTGKFVNISAAHPLLRNRSIASIHIDSKGGYWLAADEGLILTDSNLNVRKEYLIGDKIKAHPAANKINLIVEDKTGEFWLGMFFRGLMKFSPASGTFSYKQFKGIIGYNQVRTMQYPAGSNHIYVGAEGEGVIRFNIHDYSYTKYKMEKNSPNSLPDDHVVALALQGDSILWMGHLQGLSKLNLRSQTFEHFVNDPEHINSLVNNWVNHLYLDDQHILWAATFGGVSSLTLAPPRFQKIYNSPQDYFTLPSNTVQTAYSDAAGRMWFGTSMGFAIKAEGSERLYRYALPKRFARLENCEVSSFCIDGDVIWIGSWGGGLARAKLQNNFSPGDKLSFSEFYYDSTNDGSLSSNFIRNLAKDTEGNIIICTWNGGVNIIPAAQKWDERITFRRLRKNADASRGIISDYVEKALPDNEGNIWFATGSGIQRANLKKNEFEVVRTRPTDDLINYCTNLILSSSGCIYGSSFEGLVRFNQKAGKYVGHILYRSRQHGSYSLAEDNIGRLWFSTLFGEIGCYNPASGKVRLYSMIDEVDGFDFYHGATGVERNGNFYFVGKSGCLIFNPHNLPENRFAPPVYLSTITINGVAANYEGDISELRKLDLAYDDYGVTLRFAGLNYFHSDGNRYRYRIKDDASGWISLGDNPVLSFAHLKPGNYAIQFSASNNDGVWNDSNRLFNLIVHPPFWDTLWFKAGGILAAMLLIVAFFTLRIKVLHKEKEQQNLFSQKLIESQEAARKALSKELHDGLGQNLLVVKNWLHYYLSSEEKQEDDLNKINDLVQEAILEVKEMSMNLHPNLLDKLGFTKALRSMINNLNNTHKITVSSTIETIDAFLTKEAEINLYRIIQESLNNILKHSGAPAAQVNITVTGDIITVTIQDEGKGFDTGGGKHDEPRGGLGLTSMRERANYIGAKLNLRSQPGKGTIITITFTKLKKNNE